MKEIAHMWEIPEVPSEQVRMLLRIIDANHDFRYSIQEIKISIPLISTVFHQPHLVAKTDFST
jgi:hypothetical protein